MNLSQTLIAARSAFTALFNPARGDAVAALGEVTGRYSLAKIRDEMLKHKTGRRILKERPVLNSHTLDLDKLRKLGKSTFGYSFVSFLDNNKITIDSREPVRYLDDPELAYVMLRYRQVHDFWHTLSGFPEVSVESELAVKWFEFTALGMPVAMLSSLVGPLNLSLKKRAYLLDTMVPWAVRAGGKCENLMNVYYEDLLEKELKDVQQILGIEPFKAPVPNEFGMNK